MDLSRLRAGGESGGIKQTLFGLVHWLSQGDHGHGIDLVLISNVETQQEVRRLARPGDTVLDVRAVQPDIAACLNCDLVYCSFGTTEFACPGISTVVLIVDLLHRDFPDGLTEPDRVFREQQIQAALAIADCFHVISDFTADRLASCFAVPKAKVVRTYLPLHAHFASNGKTVGDGRLIERPFFFYPANTWAHKNHELLLEAYARYRNKAGPGCWPLILTGHIHESRGVTLHTITRSLGIESHVIWTGFVDEAQLAYLYAHAGALVFPSLYEGFGLPLLEAMSVDLPILASNAACIPEVVGNAALLVDATSTAELTEGLTQIASDQNLRSHLVEASRERIKAFDKDCEFGRLYQTFVSLAASPAVWRYSGYYQIDGLTDPIARFTLPTTHEELRVTLKLRPLPSTRTLRLLCGTEQLLEVIIQANSARTIRHTFSPGHRLLTIEIPDACALSATDPRTHGVLIESLEAETMDGMRINLLSVGSGHHHGSIPLRPASIDWHTDVPTTGATVRSAGVLFRGWAYARGGDQLVGVRLKGVDSTFDGVYGFARPDVKAAITEAPDYNTGWEVRPLLPSGQHRLSLEFQLASGYWIHATDITVRMASPWIPKWSRWHNPVDLLRFQFPAHAVHAPQPLRTERFPRPLLALAELPRIAIVTPSYNQGWCLEACMDSVLAEYERRDAWDKRNVGLSKAASGQRPAAIPARSSPSVSNGVSSLEIDYVVQDGGSSDKSTELIRARTSRLAAWQSAPDGGQAQAICRGFAKTSGHPTDLMAWINSDDFYAPGALRFVAEYFARHPDVDVVYGHRVVVDREGQEIARWYLPKHDPDVLHLYDFVPQETMFWRRRTWDKVGGIDTSFQFAMDWDLLLRFQEAGAKIVRLPYFLACFRVHPQQKTSALISTQGQAEIDALRRRTFGRDITPEDLLNSKALQRYLRKSAWIEQLWKWGIRAR